MFHLQGQEKYILTENVWGEEKTQVL